MSTPIRRIHDDNEPHPPTSAALALPKPPTRNTPPIWHIRAQQRAKARQDTARDHLTRFIVSGQPSAHTPYRFAELPQDAYGRSVEYDFYADAPWRPAPWAAFAA